MKTLESISLTRLTVLEFGQHIKDIVTGLGQLGGGAGFITDVPLLDFVTRLNGQLVPYDKAMVQLAKSDETAKIMAADKLRDNAVTAALRYLSAFELSPIAIELAAYASLDALFSAYKGIQNWNFVEESNGIDNLVADLTSAKYSAHVITLNLTVFSDRIKQANDDFKTLFSKRTLETSAKEVFDVKAMRNDMKEVVTDMNEYVLTMAKIKNTDEFNQSLSVINTVRKYYADLLSKRKPTKEDGNETPSA